MGIEKTDNNDDSLTSREILQNKTLEQSQDDTSVSSQTLKKGQVAMYAELNELAEGALKSSKTALQTNEEKKTTPESSNNDSSSNAAPSTTNSSQNVYVDPLSAVMMASANINISDSEFSEQVGNMQEELSQLTTDTTKAGQAWTQNFYSYGVSASPGLSEGQYEITSGYVPHTPGPSTVSIVIDAKSVYMSLDGSNYQPIGTMVSSGFSQIELSDAFQDIETAFPNYNLDNLNPSEIGDIQTAFNDNVGFAYTGMGWGSPFNIVVNNNNTTEYVNKGTGLTGADSSDVANLNSQMQYINSTVGSWTTAAQTNEGLTAPTLTSVGNTINTGQSNLVSIASVMSAVCQMLQGF